MYLETTIILIVMILIFILAIKALKLRTEIAMLLAAIGGLMAGRFWFEPRQLVEGTFTFFDIMLTIIAATIFLNTLKESGILYSMVRSLVKTFYKYRAVMLVLVMLILLIPGALTGAGTVSVVVSGGIVAIILNAMGVSLLNTTAIIFTGAALSVTAPPINVYAMIIGSGISMPYIGFFLPLLLPVLLCGLFTVFFLGWKGTDINLEEVLKELPDVPPKMKGFKIYLPLLLLIALMVLSRLLPNVMPILGTPLQFILCTVLALVIIFSSGEKVNILTISRDTLKQLFPLLATLVAVGVLVQALTLTGVRGLFVITMFSMPLFFVYLAMVVGLPIGEAVLVFGAAAVLGVPSALYFTQQGLDTVIVTAAVTLLMPMGDCLPPAAVIGKATVSITGYRGNYWQFVKKLIIPWIFISAVGVAMIYFARQLGFLVTGVAG
jgi:CitMHS family citrate-Mg2+:H+ or citrate-Ca2+:H+ symporter